MKNITFDYYTAIIFLNIFAMMILQICISRSNTLTTTRKKLFRCLYALIIVAALCEWIGNQLQASGALTRNFHILVKAIELSVAPGIAFLFSWVIEKKHEKIIVAGLLIHAIVECLSGVFGFIYYVDENSTYSHAGFYWIYILAYVISIIYCIFIVAHNAKKYQYNGVGFFLLIIVFMLTGVVIQLCDSSLRVDYVTLGIAATMIYIFTLEMIQQTDEVTELLNRRGFENYISHIEKSCIVIFCDVDNFKEINDTYGHAFGDYALKNVGKAIRKHYAKYGKCFRYGGDEFCVILTQKEELIEDINQDFLDEIMQKKKKENRFPTVSIGYAGYNPDSQNIQEALENADKMMYEYKAAGKKL